MPYCPLANPSRSLHGDDYKCMYVTAVPEWHYPSRFFSWAREDEWWFNLMFGHAVDPSSTACGVMLSKTVLTSDLKGNVV